MTLPLIIISLILVPAFIALIKSYNKSKSHFKKLGFVAVLSVLMLNQGCSSTNNFSTSNDSSNDKIVKEMQYQYNTQRVEHMQQQNMNNFYNNINKIYNK